MKLLPLHKNNIIVGFILLCFVVVADLETHIQLIVLPLHPVTRKYMVNKEKEKRKENDIKYMCQ